MFLNVPVEKIFFFTFHYRTFLLYTLWEKFWQISLYLTDDAITKLYICDVKCCQIEGNGRKFRPIELSNSIISKNVLTVYAFVLIFTPRNVKLCKLIHSFLNFLFSFDNLRVSTNGNKIYGWHETSKNSKRCLDVRFVCENFANTAKKSCSKKLPLFTNLQQNERRVKNEILLHN